MHLALIQKEMRQWYGGKLLEPVVDLLLGIGDAVISIVQHAIMGTESAVTIDTSLKILYLVAALVLATVVVGLAVIYIGPILAQIAILQFVAGAAGVVKLAVFGTAFFLSYTAMNGAYMPDITLIPTYSISPEEIFEGNVLLFDVNIFNPKAVKVAAYEATLQQNQQKQAQDDARAGGTSVPNTAVIYWCPRDNKDQPIKGTINIDDTLLDDGQEIKYTKEDGTQAVYKKGDGGQIKKVKSFEWNGVTYEVCTDGIATIGGGFFRAKNSTASTSDVENYLEKGSTGNVPSALAASKSNSNSADGSSYVTSATEYMTIDEWKTATEPQYDDNGNKTNQAQLDKYNNYKVRYYYYLKDPSLPDTEANSKNRIITSANNSALEIKDTVGKWYYTLRNLAVVSLMIILIYVGIRILISSVASEKAKYKQMLIDWFVAMCLVFVMQYIMIFANNFTEKIVDLLANVSAQNLHTVIVNDPKTELVNGVKEAGLDSYVSSNGSLNVTTNLMGKARMLAQEQSGTPLYIGYAICFLVLVFYTVFFCFIYAKRLLYIVFLTIIAPLVAISYPLDKMGDGKSQAFDLWLKEYIFNLLIQPFHLLLYTVLISSAFDLAGNNIIYCLIAIGFMTPAEKFLRKMFGFDKTTTAGFLSGAAGAAVAMSAVQKIGKINGGSKASSNKVKFADNGGNGKKAPLGSIDKLLGTYGNETPGNAGGGKAKPLAGGNGGEGGPTPSPIGNGGGDEPTIPPMENGNEGGELLTSPPIRENGVNPSTLSPSGTNEASSPASNKGDSPIKLDAPSWGRLGWRRGLEAAGKGIPTLKTVGRMGATVAGAGLGLSAGIMSGDPGNALKYTSAGLYAGQAFGKAGADRLEGAVTDGVDRVQNQIDANIKKQLGPDTYKKYEKRRDQEKFLSDPATRRKFADEFNLKKKDDIDRKMMEAAEYTEYINDENLIIKAMKFDKENKFNLSTKDKIVATRLSQTTTTQEKYDTIMKKLSDRVGKEKAANIGNMIKGLNKDSDLI